MPYDQGALLFLTYLKVTEKSYKNQALKKVCE